MLKLTDRKWKSFLIKDVFPEFKNGDIKKISKEKGDFNLVSCSSFNNGIVGTTSKGNFVKCLTVATNGECGKCFWQENKFGATIDTILLFNNNLNRQIGLFLSTVISKTLMPKYSYSFKNKGVRTLYEKIELPVNRQNNQPDWEFMEKYINEREREIVIKI